MKRIAFAAAFFLFLGSVGRVAAQVTINSFNFEGSPDWVEVVNNENYEVNFGDYSITDVAGNQIKKELFIPSRGNCVFDFSNRLNNDGDTIFLRKGEELVDCVAYGDSAGGHCERVGTSTENKPVSGCYSPTPPPTSEPTPTPTKTPTASPTPSLSPTKSATPTPTASTKATLASASILPTQSPFKTPIPPLEVTSAPTVLGLESENSNKGESATYGLPPIALIMIASGVGFFGFGIISLLRKLHDKGDQQT